MRKSLLVVSGAIPTSSMADIAFLLIIYFMVTTTFAATRGLDFRLPNTGEVVTIDRVDSVHVEADAEAPYGAMVDVLDELRQGRASLGLAEEIVISIPTRREIESYWG